MLSVVEGVVFEFQERERRQRFNFPLVSLGESAADKQCRRNSFLQKESDDFHVEIGGDSCFAGIKGKGNCFLVGRQSRNDLPLALRYSR